MRILNFQLQYFLNEIRDVLKMLEAKLRLCVEGGWSHCSSRVEGKDPVGLCVEGSLPVLLPGQAGLRSRWMGIKNFLEYCWVILGTRLKG